MDTEPTQITPEQASANLAAGEALQLARPRDRKIHAMGTAVFGITLGVLMATRNLISGTTAVLLTVALAAVLVAQVVWVERAARTVPRRAALWSRIGIGGSLLVGLALVSPWLNQAAQTEPNTVPMVAIGALAVAAPALVAAVFIGREPK